MTASRPPPSGGSVATAPNQLLARITRFHTLPGASVLEIGCGAGDLLAALEPGRGVGVDISTGMVELARRLHPQLEFRVTAGEEIDVDETFDYIVLSDLVPYVHDLLALFERVAAHAHPRTRIVINSYNPVWRPILALAERLRLKPAKPLRNWVSPQDVGNLLELAGLEQLALTRRILMPKRIPFAGRLLTGIVANVWPFNHLCLTWWIVARPHSRASGERSVSVVCPCRNEEGHVAQLVQRLPDIGAETEIVLVEGHSSDDTRGEFERQIGLHPERTMRLVDQPGTGKPTPYGRVSRLRGTTSSSSSTATSASRRKICPSSTGRSSTELINGSRLVYDMQPGAMRLLNLLGNKVFSRLFKAIT